MKNKYVMVIVFVAVAVIAAAPLCFAQTPSKPTVTLPANWEQLSETPYPDAMSEHDTAGAGMLEYQNKNTYDFVLLYYENKPSGSYTSSELKSEAEDILYREDVDISESGTKTIAGVQAGFAKSYDYDYDIYRLEVVLVKDQHYINAYAVYDATQEADDSVMSLLNSIGTGGSFLSGTTLYVIIGVVVAVIVVIIAIVALKSRKKPAASARQMPTYPGSMPPPPPPPV